ncbi:MAG: 1-deoxy-D-xylulose-5-phosphate reductoisomerase, partial [Fibrobacterales bacterium]|nr:1-deoxy-D-xylulose-5-phosphate reductoisomerase [Fibrobacterales bacterium]
MSGRQRVALLGATGSIGTSTLSVLDHHADRFELVSVAAKSSWQKVAEIVRKYNLQKAVMWDAAAAEKLRAATGIEVLSGTEGLVEMTTAPDVDVVVNGLVGSIGCLPTLRAVEADKKVALANKESLVMSGEVVNAALDAHPKAAMLPVDSEHSAVFQCLQGRPNEEVENIQLTASGGPFRETPAEEFDSITPERALKHPTWSMGTKVTIDSSTLMNKGLEVLEAHFLFRVPFDRIKVVVHPQSIVHSMVQFRDGSLMAQLAAPDMRLPIQYALTHPERWEFPMARADLAQIGKLTFFAP